MSIAFVVCVASSGLCDGQIVRAGALPGVCDAGNPYSEAV